MNSVIEAVKSMGSRIRRLARTGRREPSPCLGRGRGAVPCSRMEKLITRRLADTRSLDLRWVRVNVAPPAYELTSGEETLAILCGEVDLHTIACARTVDGKWTISFERHGPLANHVVARLPDTSVETATFEWRPLRRRLLNLANGNQYKWAVARLVPPLGQFTGADGKPLVTISAEVFALREQGTIELSPEAIRLDDLSLLTVFALYIHLLGTHKQAEWAT